MAIGNRVPPAQLASSSAWRGVGMLVLRVIGALLFVLLIPVVMRMDWADFKPIFQWTSLRFLSIGLLATVAVSLVAILASLPLATLLGLGRLSSIGVIKWPSTAFIEVVRALPLLLLIFYINLRFPGLAFFDTFIARDPNDYLNLVATTIISRGGLAVAIALTLYTAAVNAELLRSGITSLDRGQTEAARSLGLNYWQTMRLVILPQAFRRILAPLIAQFTILVKDTSLGSIIGFIELQRRGVILFQRDFNPMEALYVVALIYFVINYLLGLTSKFVERKRPSVRVTTVELG